MSESTNGAPHQPGVYVKGEQERVATTTATAVALVFDGYVLKDESPAPDADYRDLQEQAKELGIKANQSADVLRAAIDEELAKPRIAFAAQNATPETGADSLVTGTE